MTENEAIKAAETLKNWCSGKSCDRCVFYRNKCTVARDIPSLWNTQKRCRWTETDLELAKALKKVGCTEVYRPKYNPIASWRNGDYQGELPILAFQYLDPGESVILDAIIQEAENV